jgi:hypothetical protein
MTPGKARKHQRLQFFKTKETVYKNKKERSVLSKDGRFFIV